MPCVCVVPENDVGHWPGSLGRFGDWVFYPTCHLRTASNAELTLYVLVFCL
jgi:hypothetical protein